MAPIDIKLDDIADEESFDISGIPETEEGPKIPNVTTIPNESTPIQPSTKSKGNGILPVVAGLSVAAAAGIGAKAYIDHKKNNEVEEDDIEDTEYSFDEDEDYQFQYKEDSDPEFQEPAESYSARNADDLVGL